MFPERLRVLPGVVRFEVRVKEERDPSLHQSSSEACSSDAEAMVSGRTRKLRLDQFLKLEGLVSTGGEAKVRIQSGDVSVNGETETRRGRGLRPGDRVALAGTEVEVDSALFAADPETRR